MVEKQREIAEISSNFTEICNNVAKYLNDCRHGLHGLSVHSWKLILVRFPHCGGNVPLRLVLYIQKMDAQNTTKNGESEQNGES